MKARTYWKIRNRLVPINNWITYLATGIMLFVGIQYLRDLLMVPSFIGIGCLTLAGIVLFGELFQIVAMISSGSGLRHYFSQMSQVLFHVDELPKDLQKRKGER